MESSIWKLVHQFFRVTQSFMVFLCSELHKWTKFLCVWSFRSCWFCCRSSIWVTIFNHKANLHQFSPCFFFRVLLLRVSKTNFNHRCCSFLYPFPHSSFLSSFGFSLAWWLLKCIWFPKHFLLNHGETISFVKCDFVQGDDNLCYLVCFHYTSCSLSLRLSERLKVCIGISSEFSNFVRKKYACSRNHSQVLPCSVQHFYYLIGCKLKVFSLIYKSFLCWW